MEDLRSVPKSREKAEQLLGELHALSELDLASLGAQASIRMMRLKEEMRAIAKSKEVHDDLRWTCSESAAWLPHAKHFRKWRNGLAEATINFEFLVGDLKDAEGD